VRILAVEEASVSIASNISNAYVNFSSMDVSVVRISTDVIRAESPLLVSASVQTVATAQVEFFENASFQDYRARLLSRFSTRNRRTSIRIGFGTP